MTQLALTAKDRRNAHSRGRHWWDARTWIGLAFLAHAALPTAAQRGPEDLGALFRDADSADEVVAGAAVEQLEQIISDWGADLLMLDSIVPAHDEEAGSFVYACRQLAYVADQDRAVEILTLARRVADERGQPHGALAVYYQLAESLVLRGTLQEARELLDTGLAAYESWIHTPLLLFLSARVARRQERWDDALALIVRTLEPGVLWDGAYEDDPNATQEQLGISELHGRVHGFVLSERMHVELLLGLLDQAAVSVEALEHLAESSGSPELRLEGLLARAAYHHQSLQFERVLSALESFDLETAPANQRAQVLWYKGMAEGELAKREESDTSTAVALLVASLELEALDSQAQADAARLLSDLALLRDDLDAAAHWIERGRASVDSWNEHGTGRAARTLGLTVNEAQLLARSGAPTAELREQVEALELGLDAMLESWKNASERPSGLGFLDSVERRSVVGELIRLLPIVDGEEAGHRRAFEALIRLQSMGSLVRNESLGKISVDTVRAELVRESGGLLVFLPTQTVTHLFLIDGHGLEHFELSSGWVLRPKILAFISELRRRPDAGSNASLVERTNELTRLGAAASDLLFPTEVRSRVADWSAMTIVGGDFLWNLPFEALPWSDGALLGESLAIDALPSIASGIWLSRRAPSSWPSSIDLNLFATLEEFALQAGDFDGVLQSFAPDRVRTFIGSKATAEALFSADLVGVPVLQITAHGIYDATRERGAALVLAPTASNAGTLWSDDIDQLQCSGLVVLTACGAALGPRRTGGDQVAHLGGAFLRAGALAVVLTRARMEFATARALTDKFYERLTVHGDPPAAALRWARAEIVAADPARAFELAQIQLLGLGQRKLFDGRPSAPQDDDVRSTPYGAAALASAAVLVLLAAIAFARRRARTPAE